MIAFSSSVNKMIIKIFVFGWDILDAVKIRNDTKSRRSRKSMGNNNEFMWLTPVNDIRNR